MKRLVPELNLDQDNAAVVIRKNSIGSESGGRECGRLLKEYKVQRAPRLLADGCRETERARIDVRETTALFKNDC